MSTAADGASSSRSSLYAHRPPPRLASAPRLCETPKVSTRICSALRVGPLPGATATVPSTNEAEWQRRVDQLLARDERIERLFTALAAADAEETEADGADGELTATWVEGGSGLRFTVQANSIELAAELTRGIHQLQTQNREMSALLAQRRKLIGQAELVWCEIEPAMMLDEDTTEEPLWTLITPLGRSDRPVCCHPCCAGRRARRDAGGTQCPRRTQARCRRARGIAP